MLSVEGCHDDRVEEFCATAAVDLGVLHSAYRILPRWERARTSHPSPFRSSRAREVLLDLVYA
jgi:hypothetical protein